MICPHCLVLGVSAGVASIPIVPVVLRSFKARVFGKEKK